MSREEDILALLANRTDSLPDWAGDLLRPYRRLDSVRVCTPNEDVSYDNGCNAMSPIREEPMKLGTIVVFGKRSSNGAEEHPAIVTRVWGDGETPTVNIKVIPDCGEPFDATSIQHWKSQGWGSGYYYREP